MFNLIYINIYIYIYIYIGVCVPSYSNLLFIYKLL